MSFQAASGWRQALVMPIIVPPHVVVGASVGSNFGQRHHAHLTGDVGGIFFDVSDEPIGREEGAEVAVGDVLGQAALTTIALPADGFGAGNHLGVERDRLRDFWIVDVNVAVLVDEVEVPLKQDHLHEAGVGDARLHGMAMRIAVRSPIPLESDALFMKLRPGFCGFEVDSGLAVQVFAKHDRDGMHIVRHAENRVFLGPWRQPLLDDLVFPAGFTEIIVERKKSDLIDRRAEIFSDPADLDFRQIRQARDWWDRS